jgi:hypothetical protein
LKGQLPPPFQVQPEQKEVRMGPLTCEERYQIWVLRKVGNSMSSIARELGRHKSTISREINRKVDCKLKLRVKIERITAPAAISQTTLLQIKQARAGRIQMNIVANRRKIVRIGTINRKRFIKRITGDNCRIVG